MRTFRLTASLFMALLCLASATTIPMRMGINMTTGKIDDVLFWLLIAVIACGSYNIVRFITGLREQK